MKSYDHKKIEKKWQDKWEKENAYRAVDDQDKPKDYLMIEFPYPSGDGLHVGHVRSWTALDVVARKRRAQGRNVLYPIGWDAFGLPTENYALKTGRDPRVVTKENTDNFRRQIKSMGLSFDWSREINTTDPSYYKWTQWLFLQFFKKGLTYKAKTLINWCPKDKIGLANEEVIDGCCERCGTPVEKREKEQWMMAITKYAQRLYDDLDTVDYIERAKTEQRNWIGPSEGAEIEFSVKDSTQKIKVFTTRPDTLFGATYMVLAPEHPLVSKVFETLTNKEEVAAYQALSKKESDIVRTAEGKEKTGVELKGIKAINPANKEEIPIFIADYVLGSYGTGAIMAVPAHDERDGAFAKKFGLPIIQTVAQNVFDFDKTEKVLMELDKIYDAAEKKGIKFWVLGGLACAFYAKIIYREFEDIDLITKDDRSYQELLTLFGELGFLKIAEKKISEELTNSIFRNAEGIEIDIGPYVREFDCQDSDFEEQEKSLNHHNALVLSERFVKKFKEMQLKTRDKDKDKIDWEYLNGKFFVSEGFLVNSGDFNGLATEEAKKTITEFVGGKMVTTFKLRDWVFSRQRYWGEPIPMILCEKCGWQAVPEDQLPVTLPEVEKYEPTETGESPLANITDWVNTKCPKCGGGAKRETDVMPNWAGSSWYYLRYTDPHNNKEFASPALMKYWTPVDWYNGGMEHTVLHLLYSRFWHKFLFDQGLVPSPEPYMKRTSHGLILAEDGSKMSKSKGNSVSPDALVESVGADSLRLYEMFIGPFDQPVAWNNNGVVGMRRFLERVADINVDGSTKLDPVLETLMHQTIKKVTDDIENLKMNTAVSALMILLNEFDKFNVVPSSAYEVFLKLLSPFAPHLTHELWEQSGHADELRLEPWPVADEAKSKGTTAHIAIQINGKTRGEMDAAVDSDKTTLEHAAREAMAGKLEGKTVSRVIVVPNRLVNFVVPE